LWCSNLSTRSTKNPIPMINRIKLLAKILSKMSWLPVQKEEADKQNSEKPIFEL